MVSSASVKQLVGLKGQHVLTADLDAAQQRVAALTMVKAVNVSRDWPSGVKVVIVEREPWGRWRADNTVWAIDSEGVVLEGAAPSSSGPIITQTSALPAIKPGAIVDTTAVEMVAELHKLGSPPAPPRRPRLRVVADRRPHPDHRARTHRLRRRRRVRLQVRRLGLAGARSPSTRRAAALRRSALRPPPARRDRTQSRPRHSRPGPFRRQSVRAVGQPSMSPTMRPTIWPTGSVEQLCRQ